MNKEEIIKLVLQELKKERDSLQGSLQSTKQSAIEAPGAMQSHSDTTKFQMNALADNIKNTLEEKILSIENLKKFSIERTLLDTINLGSCVKIIEPNNKESIFFILPAGNGIYISYLKDTITVITPRSPLASVLMYKKKNDYVTFALSPHHPKREFTILEIW